MRTSEALLGNFTEQIEVANDHKDVKKEAFGNLKKESKRALLTENQRNNFEFGKDEKIKYQFSGSQLRKLIHESLPLLKTYFNTEEKRTSNKYGKKCFKNWVTLFQFYDTIMRKLADRGKSWTIETIETLRKEIDLFADLYILMFGYENVTIYFYLLFSGLILQQLKKFGNIARYDGNTVERFHKTYKGYIHWCTNQWDIALDTFLYFAVKHVFWVETAGKDGKVTGEFPNDEDFLRRYKEVAAMSKAARKDFMRNVDNELAGTLAEEINEGHAGAPGNELVIDVDKVTANAYNDDNDDEEVNDSPFNKIHIPENSGFFQEKRHKGKP